MKTVCTTSEAIDALDGTFETARIVDRSPQAVTNYRARNTFPPETFVPIVSALKERNVRPWPGLWRFIPLERAAIELAARLG